MVRRRFLTTAMRRLAVGEAEAARRLLASVETLVDSMELGYKVSLVPRDDEHIDALPELSRAFRPDAQYTYLVARPHAWRKQFSVKGRRLTVGQLLGRMHANALSPEEAAADFELPLEAVHEALDYGSRFADLIALEEAEDDRAARKAPCSEAGVGGP